MGKELDEEEERDGCPADREYVFGKKYTCPVCGKAFTNPTVKASRARMIGSDLDLRPVYENINTIKYDVVLCPHCGYTALERYFRTVTQVQKSLLKEKICAAYRQRPEKETFSYADAFFRYKMALLCSVTKQAYDSERAYVCLKAGWLLRGWCESLAGDGEKAAPAQEKLAAQEREFLKNALDGFQQANVKEEYPICGMDESTVDYLLAALSVAFEDYDTALRLASNVIASRVAGSRIKDRARDLKDEVLAKTKGSG